MESKKFARATVLAFTLFAAVILTVAAPPRISASDSEENSCHVIGAPTIFPSVVLESAANNTQSCSTIHKGPHRGEAELLWMLRFGAEHGAEFAQSQLGYTYAEGVGVTRD